MKADSSAILFRFFVCRNVNTYTKTEPKQELFEVDFKVDSRAIVSQNVNTYIQTQPKQELFEVDLKKDSTAIIFSFLFVATLTHTYKRNLIKSCLRLTLRRIRLRLFVFSSATLTHAHKPQLLDFHVNKRGGPLPNQKTPKQRASLDRITAFFFSLWFQESARGQTNLNCI